MSDARLTLGSLDLLGDTFRALASGFSMGSAEVVVAEMARQLMDGEIVTHVRDSNRELTFGVKVSGPDVLALNEAEALLVAEVHATQNTLIWKKPGKSTPASMFRTFHGTIREVPDVVREMGGGRVHRLYEVTLPAEPHAYSVDAVTVTAPTVAVAPVTTTLTATEIPMSTADVYTSGDTTWTRSEASWTPASPLDLTATPYLTLRLRRGSFDWDTREPGVYPQGGPWLTVDGAILRPIVSRRASSTETDFTFQVTSLPALKIEATIAGPAGFNLNATVVSIKAASALTAPGGTTRQKLVGVPVLGSVRTPASLVVTTPGAGLGRVVVYTAPRLAKGYSPALRQWMTSPVSLAVTAGTVSGSKSTLTIDPASGRCVIPASSLQPGGYLLMARVRLPSGTPVTKKLRWDTYLDRAGVKYGTQSGVKSVALTTDWQTVTFGGMVLPPVATGPAGSVTLDLHVDPSETGTVDLDEAWVFYMGDGAALTSVSAGVNKRLEVRSATVDYPAPSAWVGDSADTLVHAAPWATDIAAHEFAAGVTTVFLIAADADTTTVTATYFPRWGHNAAL